MSDAWYYAQQGQQHGPVPFIELQRLAGSGTLAATDLVWSATMSTWQPASSVARLIPEPTPSVPPSYPPQPPPFVQQPPLHYAGQLPAYQGAAIEHDAGMKWLLPVGRSGWAIAAGYLGLFSVLVVLAPIAVIISLVAIRHLRKNPRLSGWGRAIFGLVMGLLFSFVLAMFLLSTEFGRRW